MNEDGTDRHTFITKMPDIYSLLQSSGPGQINDVFADIRALVDDDDKVTSATAPQLARYNKTQLVTTKLGGRNVIISDASELGEGKFWDAIAGKSFSFDHVTLSISNVETCDVSEASTV